MNYKLIIKWCVFSLLFVLLSLNASAQTIKIEGTAVDFYGSVENAEVFVVDAVNIECESGHCRSESSTSAKTDENGKFEIYIVPPDYNKKYNLTITKENYETYVQQITLNDESRNMSLGEIKLEGIAKLEGTVIDADSKKAVEGVEVSMRDKENKTDVNGRFLIENITAETKTIKVRHNDYELQNLVYDIKPGDNFLKINVSKENTSKDYAASFYTNYSSLVIGASETKKFDINIKNIGINDAEFKIELLEKEENFSYRVLNEKEKEIRDIFVKSGRSVNVYVEVKTPENVKDGEHKFRLKVEPGENEITLTVNVVKHGFSASSIYMVKEVAAGSEVKFEITLKNNNTDDIYKLNVSLPKDWKYNITNTHGNEIKEVEITKGSKLNLYLKFEPPADEDEGFYEPSITITGLRNKETKTLTFNVTVQRGKKLYGKDDWPMFMHDLEHTGETSDVIETPKDLGVIWRFETKGTAVDLSPAVFGDYVYAGSSGQYRGYVYRFDKNTGELKWEIKIKNPVSSSLAVSRSYVYAGSVDGYVYCLYKNTGEIVWKFETGGYISSSPAVSGNYVYVGSSDNYTYCLDKNTGNLKWKFETGNAVLSSPALSRNYVYVESLDGYIYCLDKNTGELKWKFETGDYVFSSPLVSENYVYIGYSSYFGNGNGRIYCLDKNTGELKWKFETIGEVYSSPAVSENYIYAGSDDGYIYCLNKNTGELKWKFETGNGSWIESLAVSGDYVYASSNIGSYKGYIYCLDKNTGELVLKLETGGSIGKFAVSGGYIYAGITDNLYNHYFYAFTTFKPTGASCSNDSECKTKNCFKGLCKGEGYCNIDSDCYYNQYCLGNQCRTLKSSWSPCSEDLECKTKNCFKDVCREEGYCDNDSDCPSDQHCSDNNCKTFKSIGSSCSDNSECKTKNCFKDVCMEEGYIEIPWFLILGAVIFLIFLILVYLAAVKKKKSNLILLGILILIIIEIILISHTFGLFKSDVVDKTIKENETSIGTVFITINGTNNVIDVKRYKDGVLSLEKIPAGNYTFNTEYGAVSINENLECNATGVCSECCGKDLTRCSRDGCYVRRSKERIEIIINDPHKDLENEILKNDDKFKEITRGKKWEYVLNWKSCGGGPAWAYCSDIHIWFVVDGKTLYVADIDNGEYKVKSIREIQDVSAMTKEEMQKTAEKIDGVSCV